MLIINQQKTLSIPADEIVLKVTDGGSGLSALMAYPVGEYMSYNGRRLATYNTEERAKEVFLAVMKAYRIDTKTYFLPKE
jgi:hypothetical protein